MKTLALFFLTVLAATQLPAQDATNAAPAVPASPSPTYHLVPNDTVELKVYQESDLETKARVGPDGTASFPLLGSVHIGGMTLAQAAELLRAAFDRDYLVNPQVTLTIAEYSKQRFTILGQVDKPGSYEIPSQETVTLLQAVAMAGGFSRLADPGRVHVARVSSGRTETTTIDAKHETSVEETLSFHVRPDDTITVPERLF